MSETWSIPRLNVSHSSRVSRCKEGENVPVVIVGNKIDLQHERQVSTHEGKLLAQSLGGCAFLEASAKQRKNVDEIFMELLRRIRQHGKTKLRQSRVMPASPVRLSCTII